MNIKNKRAINAVCLLALALPMWADSTAGDPPSGTVNTSPDVDYMGVGMKMNLSASALKDCDCKDGEKVDDIIDPSAGVQFETSGGGCLVRQPLVLRFLRCPRRREP